MLGGEAERQLEINATHDQLLMVCNWLENMVTDWLLPPRLAYGLDLVLAEAVTNIINHACATHIILRGKRKDSMIEVELADNGATFNPVAHTQSQLPTRLEDATPGGLGILLMREYTSSMRYRRQLDGNHLTLTFPIAGVIPTQH